jgi:hypothetical protein
VVASLRRAGLAEEQWQNARSSINATQTLFLTRARIAGGLEAQARPIPTQRGQRRRRLRFNCQTRKFRKQANPVQAR